VRRQHPSGFVDGGLGQAWPELLGGKKNAAPHVFLFFKTSQKYLKFGNEEESGKTTSPAKAQRRQGSENSKNLSNFAPWRLGGINFP